MKTTFALSFGAVEMQVQKTSPKNHHTYELGPGKTPLETNEHLPGPCQPMSDAKIEQYVAVAPASYRFLKALSLERPLDSGTAGEYSLEIDLAKEPATESDCLLLRFEAVRNLRLGELEGLPGLLVEIRDASQDGLEGVRYRVAESEEETFAFDCRDFSFERRSAS